MHVGENLGGLLSARTTERFARELLEEASSTPFTPPRVLAIRLGFRLCIGAEATSADVLVYPWRPDPREQGGEHHAALARGYLLRRRVAHLAADASALAIDVALPAEERARGLAWLLWHQRNLPAAVIREVSARLRLRV